jgi:hypothetical protein
MTTISEVFRTLGDQKVAGGVVTVALIQCCRPPKKSGPVCPVAMTCGLLPSRPASTIVPVPPAGRRLAQYTWLLSTATPSGAGASRGE